MPQIVFDTEFNRFCRDHLVADGKPPANPQDFDSALRSQEAALFEQLLLFDRVALKVFGENIPAAVLYSRVGERGFEALLEQRAIEFVLWTPMILSLEENIRGVDAIAIGEHTSSVHSDPEESAEAGLGWLAQKLPRGKRKRLTRKLAELYRQPPKGLATRSWDTIREALNAGQLRRFGFPEEMERAERLDSLNREQKSHLVRSTETVLEYEFLMRTGMTSFGRYDLYSPFWASAQRFQTVSASIGGFANLARLEGIPDLKSLYMQTPGALKRLPELRQSRNARLFRLWLETTAGEAVDQDLVRAYIDAIANRRGAFNSGLAKLGRTVMMALAGMGLGSVVGGGAGTIFGGVAAPLIGEFVASAGLGLVDSMLVEQVARGWSPRMFVDDLRKLDGGEGLVSLAR